ncbi:hypothetical protein HPPC_02320 [Helicobacter pylori PeCan4]|nr:hypothetical protein HPPC_02320 [Helicobacter pylori PeCan4]
MHISEVKTAFKIADAEYVKDNTRQHKVKFQLS